jgi:hypothetical protein
MDVTTSRALRIVLLAVSPAALAQYVGTPAPQPGEPPGAPSLVLAQDFSIDPRNGQTREQQSADLYQCYLWAKGQTSFDPTQINGGVAPNEVGARRSQYRRAITACLEGRGYTVRYATPAPPAAPSPPAAAPPPYAVPTGAATSPWSAHELGYRPLTVHVEAGYTATVGATNDEFWGGGNLGVGLMWSPSTTVPLGVRIDVSDNWLDTRRGRYPYGTNFTFGHAEIYGADADLQLDLAPRSLPAQVYLFGGAGEYRDWTDLRTVGLGTGTGCGPYSCGPSTFPAVIAVDRTTSAWHLGWNAGLGGEFPLGDRLSLFVEARYLRIVTYGPKLQLVPVRVGLRF